MQHYVGLDLSVKETSVCIIDKAGKVIREVKVATKPVPILAVLTEEALAIERIGSSTHLRSRSCALIMRPRMYSAPINLMDAIKAWRFGVASATAVKSSWPARGRVFVKCDSVTRRLRGGVVAPKPIGSF